MYLTVHRVLRAAAVLSLLSGGAGCAHADAMDPGTPAASDTDVAAVDSLASDPVDGESDAPGNTEVGGDDAESPDAWVADATEGPGDGAPAPSGDDAEGTGQGGGGGPETGLDDGSNDAVADTGAGTVSPADAAEVYDAAGLNDTGGASDAAGIGEAGDAGDAAADTGTDVGAIADGSPETSPADAAGRDAPAESGEDARAVDGSSPPPPACATAYAAGQCLDLQVGSRVSSNQHNWVCINLNCKNCATYPGCAPGADSCSWGTVWSDQGPCD
jgi:hypothetical protein